MIPSPPLQSTIPTIISGMGSVSGTARLSHNVKGIRNPPGRPLLLYDHNHCYYGTEQFGFVVWMGGPMASEWDDSTGGRGDRGSPCVRLCLLAFYGDDLRPRQRWTRGSAAPKKGHRVCQRSAVLSIRFPVSQAWTTRPATVRDPGTVLVTGKRNGIQARMK